MQFYLNHETVALATCLGPPSWWKLNFHSSLVSHRLSSMIGLYLAKTIFSLALTSFSGTAEETYFHSRKLTPQCCIMVIFRLRYSFTSHITFWIYTQKSFMKHQISEMYNFVLSIDSSPELWIFSDKYSPSLNCQLKLKEKRFPELSKKHHLEPQGQSVIVKFQSLPGLNISLTSITIRIRNNLQDGPLMEKKMIHRWHFNRHYRRL